jgi:ssDNA-binding Zn-finger/Zn-ribbon topoisomerase 1
LVTHRSRNTTLSSLLDVIMDKGVIVDSRAKVRLSNIDLLDTKSRIVLSSFKTAKQIDLKFPENTNLDTQAWRVLTEKQSCPNCGRESSHEELKEECPWCGWVSRQNMR